MTSLKPWRWVALVGFAVAVAGALIASFRDARGSSIENTAACRIHEAVISLLWPVTGPAAGGPGRSGTLFPARATAQGQFFVPAGSFSLPATPSWTSRVAAS